MTDLQRSLLSLSVEGFARSAPTQKQLDESLVYSDEGIKGAMTGFLTGTIANALGAPTFGMSRAAHGAIYKGHRERLRTEIEQISKRIAQIRNGGIEKAQKDGIKIREKDLEPINHHTVIKSAIYGFFLPFYGTYQGHQYEELQKELAKKIDKLKNEFEKHGVVIDDSDEDDE